MKKQLLTLTSAIAFAASAAFAFGSYQVPNTTGSEANVNGVSAATSNGYEINFAGSPYTAHSSGNNVSYRCYIYITPEIATQLAGNQLTKISLAPALLVSNTLNGYIFVTEDINANPLTATDVTFTNGYNASNFVYQTHTLETAYEIKENTGFYFGYVMNNAKKTSTSADYVIGTDNQDANLFAGYADIIADGQVVRSISVGNEFGNNLLLKATTVGDKKDLNNLITVLSISLGLGTFALPVTDQLTDNMATVKVSNLGTNRITSINYTVSVDGGESITADRSLSISSLCTLTLSNLTLPDFISGNHKVTFTVNKINGEDITPVSNSAGYIGITDEGYPRKFIVEEGTGTWCGWCPRGIVGLDYMETTYADDFIGIAVHDYDEMQVASYRPLFDYITGFPEGMINRDPAFIIDPSAGNLSSNYTKWKTQKGAATISAQAANPADGKINVTATTTFAIDDPEANYSLAFVTLEDGIIGMQSNYYAGGSRGAMGGWENKGNTVRTSYKHVARNIYEYNGVKNSIPTQVTKGNAMTFSYDVPLDNVSNVDKSSIVVLLLDNTTGTILNGTQIHASEYGRSGVNDIITEITDAPVEYYNLQGIRMAGDNLPAGIYITRQGNKAAKVLVK